MHESFFVFFNPFYLFVDFDISICLLGVDQNELSSLAWRERERERRPRIIERGDKECCRKREKREVLCFSVSVYISVLVVKE